ncbi:UNVERIFIED_CONTAM: hypothetical protein PYX00_010197 [Menopon gallinae]|uniref:Uncharacterized protein n=1 Tax=Menopon gallinae TaxID=328185 RepID=A0AAW2HEM6_9NEOP
MSLISDVPLSNVTTYRADYTRTKPVKRTELWKFDKDYKNILIGTYEEDSLFFRECTLPEKCEGEREYEEKICERSLTYGKCLKEGLDASVMSRLHENDGRSEYMIAYCRRDDYNSKKCHKGRAIPEGWKIEETTYRCGYRPPEVLAGGRLPKNIVKRMVDNLRPNYELRALQSVKTGDSEYMAVIDKTGDEIIQGKLHGDPNIRPQFSQDEIIRAMLVSRR